MRIFLTGATGYVGSAILEASLRGGHKVTALVRDPEKAEHVSLRGLVRSSASWESRRLCGRRRRVRRHRARGDRSIEAIGRCRSSHDRDAARRSGSPPGSRTRRQLHLHVGRVGVGNTNGPAAEDAPLKPTPLAAWRPEHEELVQKLSRGGQIRCAIVRPGIVYGGARGIISDLLKNAKNGLVRVVGDGTNHWPCVYDRDLADLYVAWPRIPMRQASFTPMTKPTNVSATSSKPLPAT